MNRYIKHFAIFLCLVFASPLFASEIVEHKTVVLDEERPEDFCYQLDLKRKTALVKALIQAEEVEEAKARATEAEKHLENLGLEYQSQCLSEPTSDR